MAGSSLTTETLFELKDFFDSQFQFTMRSILPSDSERLLKNKISGLIISLQDKLLELKPKLKCNGCRGIATNKSQISITSLHDLEAVRSKVSVNQMDILQ